jgi:hypothetical protein
MRDGSLKTTDTVEESSEDHSGDSDSRSSSSSRSSGDLDSSSSSNDSRDPLAENVPAVFDVDEKPSSGTLFDSETSAEQLKNPKEEDLHELQAELRKNLEEEQTLISLQMQLLLQLEKLKSSIEKAESEERLARLASQQAKLIRLLRKKGPDDNVDDDIITIEVHS